MKIQHLPTGVPSIGLAKAAAENQVCEEAEAREQAMKLAAAGQLSATAPCTGMHNDWSADDKSQFKIALGRMFGWTS